MKLINLININLNEVQEDMYISPLKAKIKIIFVQYLLSKYQDTNIEIDRDIIENDWLVATKESLNDINNVEIN